MSKNPLSIESSHHLPPDGARAGSDARWTWVMLLMALSLPMLRTATAQQPVLTSKQTSSEYKLKVAYIYSFTRYVVWPKHAFATSDSPFVIGVLGPDPLGRSLDLLASKKKAQTRDIVIQRYSRPEDYQACHILFISDASSDSLRQRAIDMTRGQPVLLVGETPGFADHGSTVAFFRDPNGTIGFEVNVDAIQQRSLQADAKLLKIASIVRSNP